MKRLIAALIVLPSAALAHPGDHHLSGLLHLLTEPDHLAMIALAVAAVAFALFKLRAGS